jgi:hypothetical protein
MPRATVPTVDSLRPRGALTFLQPDPSPSESLSESPSDPTSLPYPPDVSPSLSDEPSDEPSDPSEGVRTSSRTSSGSALSKRTLRDACRKGVLMAGALAHTVLARDEVAQAHGVYLADDDDAEAIGDPLASIAQRRGGLGAAGNPDIADAIAALIGLALYGTKQLARFAEARAYRHAVASGTAAAGADDGSDQGAEAVSGAQGA